MLFYIKRHLWLEITVSAASVNFPVARRFQSDQPDAACHRLCGMPWETRVDGVKMIHADLVVT